MEFKNLRMKRSKRQKISYTAYAKKFDSCCCCFLTNEKTLTLYIKPIRLFINYCAILENEDSDVPQNHNK